MPYDTLPARLRAIIPSAEGQRLFRNVVNSQLAAGKSEEIAFASAWAALQRAGYVKDDSGNWVKKADAPAETAKRALSDDAFTTPEEAAVRSMDLGLTGAYHVHQTADGQAVYMPGESHDAYVTHMAEIGRAEVEDTSEGMQEDESEAESDGGADKSPLDVLARLVVAMTMALAGQGKPENGRVHKTASVLKVDTERRIVWGWASVSTMNGELVKDLQGDTITPDEMARMADKFMLSARTAKAMHAGEGIGEVIHSLPLTKEIADAFGITLDREGWIIGMKIRDDAVWKAVKEGKLPMFSIGGKARRAKA